MEKRVETVEGAFLKVGTDISQLPVVSHLPERFQDSVIGHYMMMVITEALNDGWLPDYDDYNQDKYEVWYQWSPSVGAFVYLGYGSWHSLASVGPRLVFKDRDTAKYFAETFIDQVNQYFRIPK